MAVQVQLALGLWVYASCSWDAVPQVLVVLLWYVRVGVCTLLRLLAAAGLMDETVWSGDPRALWYLD